MATRFRRHTNPDKLSTNRATANANLAGNILGDIGIARITCGRTTHHDEDATPAHIKAVYNQVNSHLDRITELTTKAGRLADNLRTNPANGRSRVTDFNRTVLELAEASHHFNALLLEHSGTNQIGSGRHAGGLLSDVHQNTLDRLAALNAKLMAATNYNLQQLKRFNPGLRDLLPHNLLIGLLNGVFNGGFKNAMVKAWRNITHNDDIVGSSASGRLFGRNHTLQENSNFIEALAGKEPQYVLRFRTAFNRTNLTDDHNNRLCLPIHGPDSADPKARKFSFIAVVKETLGDQWHRHVTYKANGGIRISGSSGWFDFDYSRQTAVIEKIYTALQKRNAEYCQWKQQNSNDVSATIGTPPPQPSAPTAAVGDQRQGWMHRDAAAADSAVETDGSEAGAADHRDMTEVLDRLQRAHGGGTPTP